MSIVRKLSMISICIACSLLTPSFAASLDNNYSGTLTDASDGLALLRAAQFNMMRMQTDIDKMYPLAARAASGTYSSEDLQKFDDKFQTHLKKIERMLAQSSLGGSIIFNHGNFKVTRNNKEVYIDLSPKTPETLGINDDNLGSIQTSQMASLHVNAAIENVKHWLDSNTDKLNQRKISSDSKKYFDYATLQIKTPEGVNSVFESISIVTTKMLDLLGSMSQAADEASRDAVSPSQRLNLNTQFQMLKLELNRIVAVMTFSNIKVFDGGSHLSVHEAGKSGMKEIDLPELSLKGLEISGINILTMSNAQDAMHTLLNLQDSISVWLATGSFDKKILHEKRV